MNLAVYDIIISIWVETVLTTSLISHKLNKGYNVWCWVISLKRLFMISEYKNDYTAGTKNLF